MNKTFEMIDMVEEFYLKMDQAKYLYQGKNVTAERKILRFDLFSEEHEEYRFARDKVEKLDAVCDMLYIQFGTLLESMTSKKDVYKLIELHLDKKVNMIFDYAKKNHFGEVLLEAFKEVHRSNLSKLGTDGKPIYREDGKIIKGPNYFPPNLKQFILERG